MLGPVTGYGWQHSKMTLLRRIFRRSYVPPRIKESNQSLRGSLKQLLNFQSKVQPSTKHCANCGSLCMHLPAEFWFDGDEETFHIWLPFCPDCNPELFARMPAVN